ncbi:hypothetical protein BH09ACT8_BH09ACT8_15070 [soil metagenome]
MPVLGRFKETDASIRHMNSPRSGFRRATAASWALAGIGVAGVAGASSLAYADTFKPAAVVPVDVEVPAAPADVAPPAVVDLPPLPDAATATVDPPSAPVEVTTEAPPPPPVTTEAPVQQYAPKQTYQQAPAPVTHQTQAPGPTKASTSSTTTRHVNVPSTVNSPKYSPHVTVSRGS